MVMIIRKSKLDLSFVSKAVRLERRIHRVADGDVGAQGWEVELEVERNVVFAALNRRTGYVLEAGLGIGLLPLPPHAVQSAVVQVEQRI